MIILDKKLRKYCIVISIFMAVSLLLGVVFKDRLMIGSVTLFFGCCQVFFMSEGVWWEEVLGLAENLLSAVICMIASLYGTVIFTLLIFVPISVFTLLNWRKNQTNGVVIINKMTTKTSLTIMFLLVSSIILVSFGISKLPGQNLPVLDTICNMLDLSAVILLALRYKEGWIMWILCSIANLVMWIILYTSRQSQNALMMIVLSLIYIGMYLWGYISFIKMRKKQEKPSGGLLMHA